MLVLLNSLRLQLHAPLHLLRWEWHGPMSLGAFQTSFDQLLTYCLRHGVTHMLADTGSMPPVGSDEQAWLSEVWLPRARSLRLDYLALILPANLHNLLVIENIVYDVGFYLSARIQFFSEGFSALDWLTHASEHIGCLEQEWQQGRNQQPAQQLI